MERNNHFAVLIRNTYDILVDKQRICANTEHLKSGILITPCISSAKALHITKFIHKYDGDANDQIIATSDIFCAKLWPICYICAKYLAKCINIERDENGYIDFPESDLIKRPNSREFKELAEESYEYIKTKIDFLSTDANNFSDSVIDEILLGTDPNKDGTKNKIDISEYIVMHAIAMLILHEYSHIKNNDPTKGAIDILIQNEKRADTDAYRELIQLSDHYIVRAGALCLQANRLFTGTQIVDYFHPDTDDRIFYIWEMFPENENTIFTDMLCLITYIWSRMKRGTGNYDLLNMRTDASQIFEYLKSEKQ